MPDESRTVVLTDRQSAYVDELVARGDFASPNDVLRAGVDALKVRDQQFQSWLETEVFTVIDALDADPDRAIPAEQVFADLRARHEARFKTRA